MHAAPASSQGALLFSLPLSPTDKASHWKHTIPVVVTAAFVIIVWLVAIFSLVSAKVKRGDVQLCTTDACIRYSSHILLKLNRSLDPCEDFSAFVCSAWWPPSTQAKYATTSMAQLVLSWFGDFRSVLREAFERGLNAANGPATMYEQCLKDLTRTKAFSLPELRLALAYFNLTWPDPPDETVRPLGVLIRLAYHVQVRLWFTIRLHLSGHRSTSAIHLSQGDPITFAYKHHKDVMQSAKYAQYYRLFYKQFQADKGQTSVPTDGAAEESARMESFILELVFNVTTKASGRPARFPITDIETYTRNLSSDEWIAEVNQVHGLRPITTSDQVTASDVSVVNMIGTIFTAYNRSQILDYIGWYMVQTYGPVVDPTLRLLYFGSQEMANEYGPLLCAKHVEASFPGLLPALYFQVRLDSAARNAASTVLVDITTTAASLIENVTWLDNATKRAAASKVRSVRTLLWPPDDLLKPDTLNRMYLNFTVNATYASVFFFWASIVAWSLRELGPMFEDALVMRQSSALPYFGYDYGLNEVSISAAALNFPLFVPDGTRVMQYAGLGYAFALQVVRALDSGGRLAELGGEIVPTNASSFASVLTAALRQKTSCLDGKYEGGFFPEIVALEVTHSAFAQTNAYGDLNLVEGFTNEQVFYISLCYFACKSPDLPTEIFNSCNKAVQHFAPFARAFNCKPGTPMTRRKTCSFF